MLVDIKNCAPFPAPAAAYDSECFFFCVHAPVMRKILQNANIGKCWSARGEAMGKQKDHNAPTAVLFYPFFLLQNQHKRRLYPDSAGSDHHRF